MNKYQTTTYSVSIDGGCLELNPRNGKWPHITDCNPRITIDIGIPSSRTLILSKNNLGFWQGNSYLLDKCHWCSNMTISHFVCFSVYDDHSLFQLLAPMDFGFDNET